LASYYELDAAAAQIAGCREIRGNDAE